MASKKRKSAIRKLHKYDHRKSLKKVKAVLQKKYATLARKHPDLTEEQLDALFVKQQREFRSAKKVGIEKKEAGKRRMSRARVAKGKPPKGKAQSIRTVQGGGVSPR